MNFQKLSLPNAHRTTLLGILLIIAAFFTGCFEYEENITIHRDGSGEITVHYAGDADSDFNMGGFCLSKEDRKMRDKIEEKFNRPGIRVKSFESKIKGDDRHAYFTVAFDDFTRLADLHWFEDQRIDAGKNAGQYFWKRRHKGDHDPDDDDSKFERWLKEEIADELADHVKFRFVIETDGEIIETNADERSSHRAVWRFDGADLMKPAGLKMKLVWR